MRLACLSLLSLAGAELVLPASAGPGNRLTHLDEPNNPWQFDQQSPKLTTPQWIGEEGVEAVIVLAIDDMSGDGQHFRDYLTPIIERLKVIDGRGAVSITCNRPNPEHPNMQWLLEEGVSLETHTLSHPCPLLQHLDFNRASKDYHGCVDLLARIPNNDSVGFRFGCMDGQNTPSPRAYSEILGSTSQEGNFISMSTSVGVVFSPDDPEIPTTLFNEDSGGSDRFARYLTKGFVNYIKNYPYPFMVGRKIWELPFVYPNDYTGQALHGAQNPATIADYKAAVDATVAKQGAVSLCFHAGNWMRNTQMVEIVDHANRIHGKKVKFLNMREMHMLMTQHLLAGNPIRKPDGSDNGIRILDVNNDGFMDVIIGNSKARICRVWKPKAQQWHETPFPVEITPAARFGVVSRSGETALLVTGKDGRNTFWIYHEDRWEVRDHLVKGLQNVSTHKEDRDGGVRLRDLDGDGICEIIVGRPDSSAVYQRHDSEWKKLPFSLPEPFSIVTKTGGDAGLRFADLDDDGQEDLIFSNGRHYGTRLLESLAKGWSRVGLEGVREGDGVGEQHSRKQNVLPPIVRADGTNNGAWLKRNHLYWQNEDTGAIFPHHIDLRSFNDLLGYQAAQPRSPATSLRAMEVHEELKVELVAAEPLVMDPVDLAWGPDGKLWVAEMADYPLGIDNNGKPGSRIVFLTDTNGDGSYNQRTLFCEGLETANTVLPWREGVLVVAPPNIWFLQDTTGNGKADSKMILYEGFGRGNEQHRGNGLSWGLDGWIYVANGDSGGVIKSTKTGKELNLGGFDLRIKPDTGEMEYATGVTQHGRNRDDWGNWVAGNNSNGWQVALEDHHLRMNPEVEQPPARHPLFGVVDLYPSSQILSHYRGYQRPPPGSPGRLTSACGFNFYRGSLFRDILTPSIYFSCPVHNCVSRREISWNGVLMQATRAESEAQNEFLRSKDSWFRPTSLRTGPDGGLYIADFYRLVIEHPEWIDPDLTREMIADGRLRAGHDRGRIYRVMPADGKRLEPLQLAKLSPEELASALDSRNGWQRDTAHMMLTWLGSAGRESALPVLRNILRKSSIPEARLQASSALADLEGLTGEDLAVALADPHPEPRRNGLRIGKLNSKRLLEKAVELLMDESPHVQMQAAYALADKGYRPAGVALGRFLLAYPDQIYLRASGLTAARNHIEAALSAILPEKQNAASGSLIEALMRQLSPKEAARVLPLLMKQLIGTPGESPKDPELVFSSAATLLQISSESSEIARWRSALSPLFKDARQTLESPGSHLPYRLAALNLLAEADSPSTDTPLLLSLLRPKTAIELQVAAVPVLLRGNNPKLIQALLKQWGEYGPMLRNAILDYLMSRTELTSLFLSSVKDTMKELTASIDIGRRQLLLKHENEAIRTRAESLFGKATTPNRQTVITQYAPALDGTGDRDRGKDIFSTQCASCHRLDGLGITVGPDLSAISDRSAKTYLTAILDPNQAVSQNWMMFMASLQDGTTRAGAIAQETSSAVTMVGIGGDRSTVPRTEIKSLSSTGLSLMPEGLEASIDLSQMRDLLAYLQVAGTPRKTFTNNTPILIAQEPNEFITLPASAAEVYGPSLVFEQRYRNLGHWGSEKDRAEWRFQIQRGGQFDLWINWALHRNASGSSISLKIGTQEITGVVPDTGDWDTYNWAKLTTLSLPSGVHRLTAQSMRPLQSNFLIDLSRVVLVPRGKGEFHPTAPWQDVKVQSQ